MWQIKAIYSIKTLNIYFMIDSVSLAIGVKRDDGMLKGFIQVLFVSGDLTRYQHFEHLRQQDVLACVNRLIPKVEQIIKMVAFFLSWREIVNCSSMIFEMRFFANHDLALVQTSATKSLVSQILICNLTSKSIYMNEYKILASCKQLFIMKVSWILKTMANLWTLSYFIDFIFIRYFNGL